VSLPSDISHFVRQIDCQAVEEKKTDEATRYSMSKTRSCNYSLEAPDDER